MKFYDWLDSQPDYGICSPPIDNATAINMLTDYLLGEDWYTSSVGSAEQITTEIIYDILYKYSKKFRKETKQRTKKYKR